MSITLWKHQEAAVQHMIDNPVQIIHADMSMGKTVMGLEFIKRMNLKRVVVIAPAKAMGVWKEDKETFGYDLDVYTVNDKTGTLLKRYKFIRDTKEGVFVITYAHARELKFSKLNLDCVIADECHRLGAYKSVQSNNVAKECQDIPYRYGFTGTAYTNKYEQLYGQLRFLFPNPLPRKQYVRMQLPVPENPILDYITEYEHKFPNSWENLFLKGYYVGYRFQKTGYKNIEFLSELVKPYILRIKAEESDLPELIQRTYHYELPPKHRKLYNKLLEDNVVQLRDNSVLDEISDNYDEMVLVNSPLAKILRLHQLSSSGLMVNEDGGTLETDVTGRLRLLGEVAPTDEPIVIFTRFKRDVTLIAGFYKKEYKEDVALLTGDVDTSTEWRNGDYRVLVANIQAGSEGVRLERARYMIEWSINYSADKYKQAIARIRRKNSKHDTVFVISIVGLDTIEQEIYDTVYSKLGNEKLLEGMLEND